MQTTILATFYTQTGPPLSLTIALLCFCGVLSLIIGVFVLGIMARNDAGKPVDTDNQDEI